MGRPIGPKKVHRYSMEFKLTAVKLSGMPGTPSCCRGGGKRCATGC